MNKIFLSILFFPALAIATEMTDAVQDVAASKMTTLATIYDQEAQVVYVGQDSSCESVSIIWPRNSIENFRVCNGEVLPRHTVSPAIDEETIRPILKSVIGNAIMYGQAKQKDSAGYLISVRALSDVSSDCKNIEVIVSYDGDLVDRKLQKICGR